MLLIQTKNMISTNYGSSKSCWKPWRTVRFYLILTMRYIYIHSNLNPLTKFTSSSRGTEFKDILPWNISQMIMKTVLISRRVVISYLMKRGIPIWVWLEVNGNWDNHMIIIYQWRKAIVEQILASDERNKSQRAARDPSRKVNHLKKVIWDRKIMTEFTRSTSSTRIS